MVDKNIQLCPIDYQGIVEGFWRQVWQCEHISCKKCCWPWKEADTTNNTWCLWQQHFTWKHPLAWYLKLPSSCHRMAYFSTRQEMLPLALSICHKCHFGPCCNPRHLAIGTRFDNGNDRKNSYEAIIILPNKQMFSRHDAYKQKSHFKFSNRIGPLARRFLSIKGAKPYSLLSHELDMTPNEISQFVIGSKWWRGTMTQQNSLQKIESWCDAQECTSRAFNNQPENLETGYERC